MYTDVGQAASARQTDCKDWWRDQPAGWSESGSQASGDSGLVKGQLHASSTPSELWSEGKQLAVKSLHQPEIHHESRLDWD